MAREIAPNEYEAGIVVVPPGEKVSGCMGSKFAPVPRVSAFLDGPSAEPDVQVRTVAVILNPFGGNGRGKRAWGAIEGLLKERGVVYHLHKTERARHATDMGRELNFDGIDALMIIGGDGTIHEAINGLMERPDRANIPPLALVPGGTGNSVCVTMEITDPVDAATAMLQGHIRRVDLGLVEWEDQHTHMINMLGWGMGADANEQAEKCRCFGQMRYDCGAMVEMCRNADRMATFEIDGEAMDGNFVLAFVQNNQHSGVNLRFCPFAKLDDGFMDLIFVEKLSRATTANIFNMLKAGATHVYAPELRYHRVRKLRIDTGDQVTLVNVDGENCARTPVTITTIPHAVRVFARGE